MPYLSYRAGTLSAMSPAEFTPPRLPQADIERLVRQAQQLASLARDAQQMADMQKRAAKFARSLQPHLPTVQETLRQMAELNGTAGIVNRQREAMASITTSFKAAPVPTPADLHEAEAALRCNLPETPEQIGEVAQLAESISADSEGRTLIEHITRALTRADLSEAPRVAIPVLLYWWLCHALRLPLTGDVTPAQQAAYIAVVGVVVTVLFYLWPSS